jgi:hypothetical protein
MIENDVLDNEFWGKSGNWRRRGFCQEGIPGDAEKNSETNTLNKR